MSNELKIHKTIIEPSRGFLKINWTELWQYRELFGFLVWRDFVVKYKQALFGVAWALVGPLVSTVVFTLIFGNLAKLPSDGLPSPLFYMAGLIMWRYFAGALTNCSNSLVSNQALLTKIYVPRIIIPISSCINQMVDFFIGLLMLFLLMIWFDKWPGFGSVLVLPLLMLTMLTALGWGLMFGALNVRFRDIRQVLPLLLQLWMYITVIFPFSQLPERWGVWRYLYGLNPMAGIVEGFRYCLMSPYMDQTKSVSRTVGFPAVSGLVESGKKVSMDFVNSVPVWQVMEEVASPLNPPWLLILIGIFSTGCMLVTGLYYFKKVETQFADII